MLRLLERLNKDPAAKLTPDEARQLIPLLKDIPYAYSKKPSALYGMILQSVPVKDATTIRRVIATLEDIHSGDLCRKEACALAARFLAENDSDALRSMINGAHADAKDLVKFILMYGIARDDEKPDTDFEKFIAVCPPGFLCREDRLCSLSIDRFRITIEAAQKAGIDPFVPSKETGENNSDWIKQVIAKLPDDPKEEDARIYPALSPIFKDLLLKANVVGEREIALIEWQIKNNPAALKTIGGIKDRIFQIMDSDAWLRVVQTILDTHGAEEAAKFFWNNPMLLPFAAGSSRPGSPLERYYNDERVAGGVENLKRLAAFAALFKSISTKKQRRTLCNEMLPGADKIAEHHARHGGRDYEPNYPPFAPRIPLRNNTLIWILHLWDDGGREYFEKNADIILKDAHNNQRISLYFIRVLAPIFTRARHEGVKPETVAAFGELFTHKLESIMKNDNNNELYLLIKEAWRGLLDLLPPEKHEMSVRRIMSQKPDWEPAANSDLAFLALMEEAPHLREKIAPHLHARYAKYFDGTTGKYKRRLAWADFGDGDMRWEVLVGKDDPLKERERESPHSLTEIQKYSPWGFSPKTFRRIHEIVAPVIGNSSADTVAFKLAILFSNVEEAEKYLIQATKASEPGSSLWTLVSHIHLPLSGAWHPEKIALNQDDEQPQQQPAPNPAQRRDNGYLDWDFI